MVMPILVKQTEDLLSFVWWNTSLAPRGKTRATPEQQQVAVQMVQTLITNIRVDFIALGEVSPNEKEVFRLLASTEGYALLDGFAAAGRSQFDMLFFYNISRLKAIGPSLIVDKKGGRTLRVAQRIDIFVSDAKRPFHLFVSHWPSRLHKQKDHTDRQRLGIRLGDSVREVFEKYKEIPNVILLGDYNDEPFDNSLAEGLRSTRDRKLAKKKKELLYNPFWQYLGAACNRAEESRTLGGTYYYPDGDITNWHLFDQMIFSSSFLGDGEWMLEERLTQVVDIPNYSVLLENRKENFDHAPILGVVRRI